MLAYADEAVTTYLARVRRLAINCFYETSVAEHGDSIGQMKDFVHLVRDVEDRHAARTKLFDHAV